MSKQSSVEWLVKELNDNIDFIPMSKWDKIRDIVQQAKAMHKEEIANAWNDGHTEGMGWDGCFATYEEYYNETFGGQDNE